MALTIIFVVSGTAIIALLLGKVIEERRKQPVFISNIISRGDVRVRELSHEAARLYAEYREKLVFFVEKQAPLRTKTYINKTSAQLRERAHTFIESLRDSRLLKKSDGISEFFKSISEKENGRIDDTLEEIAEDREEK